MDVLDGDDHSWHDMVSWVESGTGTRRSCIDRTTAATLEWQYFEIVLYLMMHAALVASQLERIFIRRPYRFFRA